MKKLFCLLLALALLFCLSTTAFADIIWEPFEGFYTDNREYFTYAGYYAYANGPAGEVFLYDQPGGKQVGAIPNGKTVYIQHIYETKGSPAWALFTDETYALLSDLMNRYDREFFDDHPEIATEAPSGFSVTIPLNAPMLTWTYPRGVCSQVENRWDENIMFGMTDYYTDEDGLVWGYMGYWLGHQDMWICLSDYNNSDLQKPEKYLGTPNWGDGFVPIKAEPLPEVRGIDPLYIILPIGAAVIAAALLIFWPKKKKEEPVSHGEKPEA